MAILTGEDWQSNFTYDVWECEMWPGKQNLGDLLRNRPTSHRINEIPKNMEDH